MHRLEFEVALELAADFADIISVKLHDFALGDPANARSSCACSVEVRRAAPPDPDRRPRWGSAHRIVLAGRRAPLRRLRLSTSLDPHERWDLTVDVVASLDADADPEPPWSTSATSARRSETSSPRGHCGFPVFAELGEPAARVRPVDRGPGRPADAHGRVPSSALRRGHAVVHDGLRPRHRDHLAAVAASRPRAGDRCPRRLAELQATSEDPAIDAEPGKIVHEVRHGRAPVLVPRYYGSIDSTPALPRAPSRDVALDRRRGSRPAAAGPALLALEWIDRYGDLDGDGFVEYAPGGRRPRESSPGRTRRLAALPRRRFAEAPVAPVEVQGYVWPRSEGSRSAGRLARAGARRTARRRGRQAASSVRQGFLGRGAGRVPRSRWTASGTSTPAARTWVTCSGAGCLFPSESRR